MFCFNNYEEVFECYQQTSELVVNEDKKNAKTERARTNVVVKPKLRFIVLLSV